MGFAQLEKMNFFLNKKEDQWELSFLNFLKASKTKLLKAQRHQKNFIILILRLLALLRVEDMA